MKAYISDYLKADGNNLGYKKVINVINNFDVFILRITFLVLNYYIKIVNNASELNGKTVFSLTDNEKNLFYAAAGGTRRWMWFK